MQNRYLFFTTTILMTTNLKTFFIHFILFLLDKKILESYNKIYIVLLSSEYT